MSYFRNRLLEDLLVEEYNNTTTSRNYPVEGIEKLEQLDHNTLKLTYQSNNHLMFDVTTDCSNDYDYNLNLKIRNPILLKKEPNKSVTILPLSTIDNITSIKSVYNIRRNPDNRVLAKYKRGYEESPIALPVSAHLGLNDILDILIIDTLGYDINHILPGQEIMGHLDQVLSTIPDDWPKEPEGDGIDAIRAWVEKLRELGATDAQIKALMAKFFNELQWKALQGEADAIAMQNQLKQEAQDLAIGFCIGVAFGIAVGIATGGVGAAVVGIAIWTSLFGSIAQLMIWLFTEYGQENNNDIFDDLFPGGNSNNIL